jgi:hypothetical protein
MPLCTPTLIGPISTLSKSVVVAGGLPGAKITIECIGTNPRVLGNRISKGGYDRVVLGGLLASTNILAASDVLIVFQELDGETSEKTPASFGLTVLEVPTDLTFVGYVGLKSHPYTCGEYLWVEGAIPGAVVSIEFDGGVKGSAVAKEDGARVKLSTGLPLGPISIFQSLSIGDGPKLQTLPDKIANVGYVLPAPQTYEPLIECQTAIPIFDVFDGATVEITGTVGGDSRYNQAVGFDLSALNLRLKKPLNSKDVLTLKQKMAIKCELNSNPSIRYQIKSINSLQAPVIVKPLCAGSRTIRVENLTSGSTVTININGSLFKGMAPHGTTGMDFLVTQLTTGTVKASQSLCGHSSPYSDDVTIDPAPAVIDKCKLFGPLLSCSRSVTVGLIHPGSILQVWREDSSTGHVAAISTPPASVFQSYASIEVSPFLKLKDKIWIRQWACNGIATDSNVLTVEKRPLMGLPVIENRTFSNTLRVDVLQCSPGAKVSLYLFEKENPNGWRFLSSAIALAGGSAEKGYAIITLAKKLRVGSQLKAKQTSCGEETQFGPVVTVRRPPPLEPTRIAPLEGITVSSLQPELAWKDPGDGTDAAADAFNIEVVRYSTRSVVFSTLNFAGTLIAVNVFLESNTDYLWSVNGVNSTELGPGFLGRFRTPAASPVSVSTSFVAKIIASLAPNGLKELISASITVLDPKGGRHVMLLEKTAAGLVELQLQKAKLLPPGLKGVWVIERSAEIIGRYENGNSFTASNPNPLTIQTFDTPVQIGIVVSRPDNVWVFEVIAT